MAFPILVTGATGRLGRLVVARLLERPEKVRVFVRKRKDALALWGDAVEVAEGDFADFASLKEAARGTRSLFLLSPISENLTAYQNTAVDAARLEGVSRIVKISGSDWTIRNAERSISGAAHAAVEAYLSTSGVAYTALRPNAWMQVGLSPVVASVRQGEDVPGRYGEAAVSFIDAEDIADVAVHALTANVPVPGPLILTGNEALTSLEIARIAAGLLKRPIGVTDISAAPLPPHLDHFERQAITEFVKLIGEGLAEPVTDTVFSITGQPPRSVEAYLQAQLPTPGIKTSTPKGGKTWH